MTAQNKETYLESMNEEYKQKHYPEGSVFKAHKKAMKGVNAGLGLFFMGAFLAGSCRLPRYLTKPRQRRSKWDMAGSDGISRVSAVFRGKSLLTNKMRII